jgi:hypothetical protein
MVHSRLMQYSAGFTLVSQHSLPFHIVECLVMLVGAYFDRGGGVVGGE